MASPANPEVVDQIIRVRVADVRLGDRLRPVDPTWAEALGRIMLGDRQRTPIEVCRMPGKTGFLLVAGGHRLTGAQLVGMEFLEARIVSADALERKEAEVSENIWRKGLDPIDRAAFVAELVQIRKIRAGLTPDQDGRSVSAQARWSETLKADADDASATIALAYGWADGVADTLGFSRRTIYNDLELHRGLKPDVAEQIRATGIATNAGQLRALAKLEEREQRHVAAMIAGGEAKSVSEAQGLRSQKPQPSPEAKLLSAFLGSYSRMGTRERRLALADLKKLGLPSGITLTLKGDADDQ